MIFVLHKGAAKWSQLKKIAKPYQHQTLGSLGVVVAAVLVVAAALVAAALAAVMEALGASAAGGGKRLEWSWQMQMQASLLVKYQHLQMPQLQRGEITTNENKTAG